MRFEKLREFFLMQRFAVFEAIKSINDETLSSIA
jgi:hypothetical protein